MSPPDKKVSLPYIAVVTEISPGVCPRRIGGRVVSAYTADPGKDTAAN